MVFRILFPSFILRLRATRVKQRAKSENQRSALTAHGARQKTRAKKVEVEKPGSQKA
jgi:hypothetical protein